MANIAANPKADQRSAFYPAEFYTMNTTSCYRMASVLAILATMAIGSPAPARAGTFPPLNSPATGETHQGKFVWVDLFSSDTAAASDFYSKLFGWTITDLSHNGRTYIVFKNGDKPVAGLVARASSKEKHLSRWIPYVSVSDIQATLGTVKSAGGIVRAPARNFPDRGWQAIISDPEGAVLGLLQSSSGDSADTEPATGDWNWFELYSKNAAAASSFYTSVIKYQAAPDTRTERKGDFELSSDGRARAGIAPFSDDQDSKSGWLVVVRVADISAAVAEAGVLGGEVDVAPRPAAYGSRFAIITDPTGGTIGLVQFIDNADPANRP
jgi:predicted enzyme related to lactoylglutathione lyase